jgi:hypothetical protein
MSFGQIHKNAMIQIAMYSAKKEHKAKDVAKKPYHTTKEM